MYCQWERFMCLILAPVLIQTPLSVKRPLFEDIKHVTKPLPTFSGSSLGGQLGYLWMYFEHFQMLEAYSHSFHDNEF